MGMEALVFYRIEKQRGKYYVLIRLTLIETKLINRLKTMVRGVGFEPTPAYASGS